MALMIRIARQGENILRANKTQKKQFRAIITEKYSLYALFFALLIFH